MRVPSVHVNLLNKAFKVFESSTSHTALSLSDLLGRRDRFGGLTTSSVSVNLADKHPLYYDI